MSIRPRARNVIDITERINTIAKRLRPLVPITTADKLPPPKPRLRPRPIREACLVSHRKAEEAGVLVGRRTPASLVGALLAQVSAETALTLLDIARRTCVAVIEEEANGGD